MQAEYSHHLHPITRPSLTGQARFLSEANAQRTVLSEKELNAGPFSARRTAARLEAVICGKPSWVSARRMVATPKLAFPADHTPSSGSGPERL